MQGQWRGTYAGTNGGDIVVELDDLGTHYEGSAYLHDGNQSLPGVYAFVRTASKNNKQSVVAHLKALHPHSGVPMPFAQVSSFFPGIGLSETADVEIHLKGSQLLVNWNTDLGTSGSAKLPRSAADELSKCRAMPIENWAQFKEYAVSLTPRRAIFRGQPGQWRLRTAFHRSGRSNLDRFLQRDMPAVHGHLSAVTKHHFDVRDPLQNAAFLNLIQHHGYPTPLLDWTYSPFVAAHFAFTERQSDDGFARIYVFEKEEWCARFPQIQNTADRRPHFSIIEALAVENARMVPQQALSSFTNVDDVESYITSTETKDQTYLSAIDLPRSERTNVLRELRLMGITPGSLFPGLDGACAELRERFFP